MCVCVGGGGSLPLHMKYHGTYTINRGEAHGQCVKIGGGTVKLSPRSCDNRDVWGNVQSAR